LPFSFMILGFIIDKIWNFTSKPNSCNRSKPLHWVFKAGFIIIVFVLLFSSLYSSTLIQELLYPSPFSNPVVFAERYPLDTEGIPDKGVIVGGASRKAIEYNLMTFFPYWGMGRYSDITPETIPKEPIQTLKKFMSTGSEFFMFKGGASDRDVPYFQYLEAEHDIILKDFSRTFCKLELVEKNDGFDTNIQSDEICYSPPPTSKITFEIVYSCNCVAFRLDDVRDFNLNNVQIQIMEVFRNHKIPLTIGIIGNSFGEDDMIINYIVKQRSAHEFELDLANHGWEHERFSKLEQDTQSLLIKKTNERIYDLVGVYPTLFIPPYNVFNNDTILAAIENNMTHFSAGYMDTSEFFPHNFPIYHIPQTATTGKIDSYGLFSGLNHNMTFNIIQSNIANRTFSVVTLHPYEYAIIENGDYINEVNYTQIAELELLLTKIQEEGIRPVPLQKIKIPS